MPIKDFGLIKNKIEEGIKSGLNEFEEYIFPVIQENTPVDTGALRKSEKVEDLYDGLGKRFSADVPYAKRQHEDLTLNHPRGGRAKYILSPIVENMDEASEMIAESVRRKLNGGV